MKRQDIIKKLMKEGMTEKTLVNMTDKQLTMLSERIFSEQYGTIATGTQTPTILNIPKEKTQDIATAKSRKQTFATYENEMKENELKGSPKKEDKKDEKDIVIKRLAHKIEHCTDDKKIDGWVDLAKKINDGKIPEKIQKLLKGKKEPVVAENKKAKKWVNKIVENKISTSKSEIIDLIKSKLNEQEVAEPEVATKKDVSEPLKKNDLPDWLTYDAIMAAQPATKPETKPAEPTTKPGPPKTKPGTNPKPWNPFEPQKGPDHSPKMKINEATLSNIIRKNILEMAMDFDTPDRPHPDYPEQLRTGNTPLRKVPFPETGREDQNFQELLGSERYKDIVNKVRQYTGLGDDETIQGSMMSLVGLMGDAFQKTLEIESEHLEELEDLAVRLVRKEMGVPEDAVQFNAKIKHVTTQGTRRDREQTNPTKVDMTAEADAASALQKLNWERAKRRLVNAMIQGSAANGQYLYHYVVPELIEITGSEELPNLYGILMSVNDSLYWQIGNERIVSGADEAGGGKVKVDRNTEPPTIIAEALNFPMLVHELVKGVMELLSYQAEPKPEDVEGQEIYRQALELEDTLEKELWDLRLGPAIWSRIRNQFPENVITDETKYELQNWILGHIFKLQAKEFLVLMMKVVSSSEEGKRLIKGIYDSIVAMINRQENNAETEIFEDDIDEITENTPDEEIQEFMGTINDIPIPGENASQQEWDAYLDSISARRGTRTEPNPDELLEAKIMNIIRKSIK